VVSLEFEDGLTATMTVQGLSDREGRWLRIDGSEATLLGDFGFAGERIELQFHRDGRRRLAHRRGFSPTSHGGGDAGLMDSFVRSLAEGREDQGSTGGREALESHLMAFAADLSRREGRQVELGELRKARPAS
jgi:predicted dehydrogenase